MDNETIRQTVANLQEMYKAQDLLSSQIQNAELEIKREMENREIETLDLCNGVIIRYSSILTYRFDTKRFKEDFADIYQMFLKEVPSKRFKIAA